jgi:hypothetical protein
MLRKFAAVAALFVLIAAPALAQAPPPGLAWVRGTVEKLDGDKLMIKASDGMDMTVALTAKTRINTLVKKSLADIKPGDFLASTGVKGTDGKLHAVEVRILPRAAAANGGNQSAWDLLPNSVMTNATVGSVTKAPEGEIVHVKFKGGEAEYSIGPDVPILAPAPGDRSLLKPGAAVVAFGRKAPDGGLTAAVIYAEKNGVKPPM